MARISLQLRLIIYLLLNMRNLPFSNGTRPCHANFVIKIVLQILSFEVTFQFVSNHSFQHVKKFKTKQTKTKRTYQN